MSQGLPRVARSASGYDAEQVDLFLARARAAYAAGADGPAERTARTVQEAPVDPGRPGSDAAGGTVTAEGIRTAGFDTRRGGYSREHVDAALDRLESVFSTREREARMSEVGAERWHSEVRGRAQELLDRLDREPRSRFRRGGRFRRGYRMDDVDELCDLLVRYFRDDEDVSPDEVRSTVFRSQRKGYEEAQVDHVLDAVVDVMLSMR